MPEIHEENIDRDTIKITAIHEAQKFMRENDIKLEINDQVLYMKKDVKFKDQDRNIYVVTNIVGDNITITCQSPVLLDIDSGKPILINGKPKSTYPRTYTLQNNNYEIIPMHLAREVAIVQHLNNSLSKALNTGRNANEN